MTIINEIATHADGEICTAATTTFDCSHSHTYTAAPEPAAGVKGLLITPTGETVIAAFADLADYQRAVGGWIETVRIDERHDVIANEEGLSYKLPFNALGSAVAGRPIVGNVIIVGVDQARCSFGDVDEGYIIAVRRVLSVR